jgi:outer membrane biosynthesis protein TonB
VASRIKYNRFGSPGALGNTTGRILPVTSGLIERMPITPETEAESSWWSTFSEVVHGTLDVVGMLPGAGNVADLANAALYTAEGDLTGAALSLAAAVPGAGQAVTAAKLARKANKVRRRLSAVPKPKPKPAPKPKPKPDKKPKKPANDNEPNKAANDNQKGQTPKEDKPARRPIPLPRTPRTGGKNRRRRREDKCEELSKILDSEAAKLPQKYQKVFPSGDSRTAKISGEKNSTLVIAELDMGEGPQKIAAHSKYIALSTSKYTQNTKIPFVQGLKDPLCRDSQLAGQDCCSKKLERNSGKQFQYMVPPKPNGIPMARCKHSEARIIESWIARGGKGTVTMVVSRPVCPQCARLIRYLNCCEELGLECDRVRVCEQHQTKLAKGRLECPKAPPTS